MIPLDRTEAPSFQLSSDYSLARPEIFQLSGNQKLFAFRDLQQEAVKLELVFRAGKWHESKLGVSHFTSHMLSKGTHKKNSFQIAEGLDSLGVQLEISPGFDVVSLSLFTLRKNLLAALRIVVELLEGPSFEGEELRLLKEIFSQALRVNNEKTNVVASKEIRKAVFGISHPYGSSMEETDIEKIDRLDLQHFFHDHFSLHSAFLIGRLSDEEVKEVVKIIPSLVTLTKKEPTFENRPGVSHTITKPDSVQASIRLGKKCLPKTDSSEYFEAVMFNHILGGFFGSRLMKNIREEKGLTYGIYSSMNHFLRDNFWMIGAEVNQKNAGEAIQEIKSEIKILQEERISVRELDVAKNYFIGSWQSENSTLFSVADKIKNIYLWGLPDGYYSHMLEHIQHITPAQIQSIANRYFDSTDLLEIQVG